MDDLNALYVRLRARSKDWLDTTQHGASDYQRGYGKALQDVMDDFMTVLLRSYGESD